MASKIFDTFSGDNMEKCLFKDTRFCQSLLFEEKNALLKLHVLKYFNSDNAQIFLIFFSEAVLAGKL